jgi:hypothetical protein
MNLSYLEAWEVQPGIHIQVLHPSTENSNPPHHQDRGSKRVLVNTPTFTWAYTRTFKEMGFEEILYSVDTGSFSN